MKKKSRISITVTILLIIYSGYASYMVYGLRLFQLNTQLGWFLAVTYRWAYIATAAMILITALVKVKEIKADKAAADKVDPETSELKPKTEINTEPEICSVCGQQRTDAFPFCSKCGTAYSKA